MPTYSQISFKASHNSYERKESTAEQLTFHPGDPSRCGCMSLEFDIWRHTTPYTPGGDIDRKFFTIGHAVPSDTPLERYLGDALRWHEANPNHPPVLIYLDIKSSMGGYDDFHLQIDTYLKRYFDSTLIYRPGAFSAAAGPDLCGKVISAGWDDLASMAGKFIFCLTGNRDWKEKYASIDLLESRLCFSDRDLSDNDSELDPPDRGDIVFFSFHIFHAHRRVWMKVIPRFAMANMITRAYEADSEDNWSDCLKAQVSALATNKLSNHAWAKVSDSSVYALK